MILCDMSGTEVLEERRYAIQKDWSQLRFVFESQEFEGFLITGGVSQCTIEEDQSST